MRRSTATFRTSGCFPTTRGTDGESRNAEGRSMTPTSTPAEDRERVSVPASQGVQVLLDASAMLLTSVSVEAVVEGIVDLARQVIKADAYAVWRTYDGLHWRVLAACGLSPGYRNELT